MHINDELDALEAKLNKAASIQNEINDLAARAIEQRADISKAAVATYLAGTEQAPFDQRDYQGKDLSKAAADLAAPGHEGQAARERLHAQADEATRRAKESPIATAAAFS